MPKPNRREFLRNMGQGTLAAGLCLKLPEGAWMGDGSAEGVQAITARAGEGISNTSFADKRVECDVLVAGGGFAALFAAIKAREQGANVLLVSKGHAGKSGQSPLSEGFMCFNPEWGHKLDEWVDHIHHTSEYLSNREWNEIVIKETYDRYKDLLKYGVQFRMKDGQPTRRRDPWGPSESLRYINSARYELYDEKTSHPTVLRRYAEQIGIKIIDRVMLTELMQQNGRIVGGIGLSVDSQDLYTFVAKATVLAVGSSGLKPAGYPMIYQNTADGEAMAYRHGAEILGKEFVDTHFTVRETPSICSRVIVDAEKEPKLGREKELLGQPFMDKLVDFEGKALPPRPPGASGEKFTYPRLEFEVDKGHAPVYWRTSAGDKELVGGACLGMSLRKADGIWPANTECAASIPGLYAAGDTLGNMENGALYEAGGSSTASCTVTGARVGTAAAKEAKQMGMLMIDEKEIARAQAEVRSPRERKGGFSPRWLTQHLQNTMQPYFVSYIKKGNRLEAALTQVEFMQEHLVPQLFARDAHELRLVHETRNMVLTAEMRLRSALFRTESRGNHYREDYPFRDDQHWLAWTKIKEEQGKMKLIKVPMPKAWAPDPSTPYRQRYPFPFPGEERS